MKTLILFLMLLVLSACSACSPQKDDIMTVAGADSAKISLPAMSPPLAIPAFPASPFPSVAKPESGTTGTTPATTTSTGSKTESCRYAGRYNGDRPTWYCPKDMAKYPATFIVSITGCLTETVTNNGKRWTSSKLIAKQSDVSGRGLALVGPSSCSSTTASVRY